MQFYSPVDSIRKPSHSSSNPPQEIQDRIAELKVKHRHVYAIPLGDDWYLTRPLTWREHKQLVELGQDDVETPDKIVELTLLHPESIDDVLAGVVDTLANAIVNVSGFSTMEAFEEGIEWGREQANLLEQQLIMMICKAFPAYKPEELYEYPFLDLMLRWGMAEQMLGLAPDGQGAEGTPREMQQGQRIRFPEYQGAVDVPIQGPPVSQSMEAYGDLPPIPDTSAALKRAIKQGADLPDFEKDNQELPGNG